MNLTDRALKSPIGVAVGVGLIVVLGIVALVRLPVQLFPDIEEPVISIFTGWRAAAPAEVESELIEPQEQALRGLPGLQEIQSFANAGGSFVNLEFAIGTDMGRTLIDVISRMNQLPPLPRDADAPRIELGAGFGGSPNETLSWFFVQLKPGTPGPVENYRREVEDLMRSRVESIPGVGTITVHAGAPDELRIAFDPYRAAELGIPIPVIAGVAGSANDVSGGFAELGRRAYTLRFAGRYQPEQLGDLVLDWRDGRPVRLADVATISVERGDRNSLAVQNNNPAIAIEIKKESGADVLATLSAVRTEIEELREGPLAEMGLAIEQSFDPSVFINQALGLVGGNLVAGVILAIGVLWLFLRQFRSTLLVGVAIPVSVLATVLVMMVTGHSLNVISIAGIAFAVGMTLDAATIVLESILAHREKGLSPAPGRARGREPRVAGAVRLDADDDHRLPARHLHEQRRRAAVRGPRAHHLGRDRGVADRGGDGAAGRRRALAEAHGGGAPGRPNGRAGSASAWPRSPTARASAGSRSPPAWSRRRRSPGCCCRPSTTCRRSSATRSTASSSSRPA